MKSLRRFEIASLLVLTLAGLASCGSNKDSTTTSAEDSKIQFVAAGESDWDIETTIGSYTYTFDFDLNADKTVLLSAHCEGKAQSSGGGGNFPWGGGDFPGFGAIRKNAESSTSSSSEDLRLRDFTISGSWTEEAGYGYIITMNDADNTVIHTDFMKYMGRHQFYYTVKNTDGSATVRFQNEDPDYRSKLASNYQTWDERDSTYIFTADATGNNSSLATAFLYAHSNNSVVIDQPNGSDRSVTLGLKWKIENDKFVLIDGQTNYTADTSINTAHPGYRVAYDDLTFFCSTSSSVASYDMANADFDGTTLYQFTGSVTYAAPFETTASFELNLTDSGGAFLYSGNSLSKKGTYTFTEDVFTLNFDGEEPVTVAKENGKYTYSFQIEVSTMFGSKMTLDVSMTYTPAE